MSIVANGGILYRICDGAGCGGRSPTLPHQCFSISAPRHILCTKKKQYVIIMYFCLGLVAVWGSRYSSGGSGAGNALGAGLGGDDMMCTPVRWAPASWCSRWHPLAPLMVGGTRHWVSSDHQRSWAGGAAWSTAKTSGARDGRVGDCPRWASSPDCHWDTALIV